MEDRILNLAIMVQVPGVPKILVQIPIILVLIIMRKTIMALAQIKTILVQEQVITVNTMALVLMVLVKDSAKGLMVSVKDLAKDLVVLDRDLAKGQITEILVGDQEMDLEWVGIKRIKTGHYSINKGKKKEKWPKNRKKWWWRTIENKNKKYCYP